MTPTPDTPGPHLRDVSPKPRHIPGVAPDRVVADSDLVWTDEEQEALKAYQAQYPTNDGAVMRALWLAQGKYGFLPPEVIRFVADTLELPYAKVYGVATFYTQYYKEDKGQVVFDVCTCFSCQLCGGYDMLHYLEQKLGVEKGGTSADGMFCVQEAECLGACGSAPMLQVTNGPYVHNLTTEKLDALVDGLRNGQMPPFESVTLPQDEDELGGNRRTDAEAVTTYETPPVSETLH